MKEAYCCQGLQSIDSFMNPNRVGYTQNHKDQIRLWQKTPGRACRVLEEKLLWTDETNMNLNQNDEKRKVWQEIESRSQSEAHHIICQTWAKYSGLGMKWLQVERR